MLIGEVTAQTARKAHVCWWCGEQIEPGDEYTRWLWKDAGDVQPVKTHRECREAWSTLPYGENEVEFGEFCRGCTCERGACRCEKARDK